MKLTAIILLMACLQVSAKGTAQLITYSGTDVPLKTIFSEIKRQSGFVVFCNYQILQSAKKVTIHVKDASVEEVLNAALKGQDLSFSIEDKTVVITQKTTSPKKTVSNDVASVPPARITGKVVDADGRPLSGANIQIKGTNTGVVADQDGNFLLTAPEIPVVLEISYIGYTTRTVTVTSNTITVRLESAVSINQEVVVTALGISKASRKVGYAVTKVDGGLLNQAKEPNVANSLTGRVAGLNVSGVNSGPGASARILIRGISNFTSTTGPLFVIDGVPMDNTQKGSAGVYGGPDQGDGISSINPDDIENVVVLKGSTASALYGTRASNGVIQITTKSGKGAKGFGVEYNGNLSFNSVVNDKDYQKVYGAGLNGLRPMTLSDLTVDGLNSWGEKFDGTPSIEQDGQLHPYKAVADQYNHFYRVAPVYTNTL